MNAKEFFDIFVQEATDEKGNYKKDDCCGFTHGVISPAMCKIIKEVAEYEYYPEYYKIDYTGWDMSNKETIEKADALGFNSYYWDLKIAVEHENDPRDWNYEVFKLAPLKCPLRVVIGYSNRSSRKSNDCSDAKKLEYLANVLKEMKNSFYRPTQNEEFLIIIGNNSRTKADYAGYIYDNDSQLFKPLAETYQA